MAIDSRIALGVQVPDAVGSVQKGLLTRSTYDKAKEDRQNAPLRNKLLQTQQDTADLALDDATQLSELKSIAIGAGDTLNAFKQNGIQGGIDYLNQRIENGATVEGGRGMGDSQEALDYISTPGRTPEEIESYFTQAQQGAIQGINILSGKATGDKKARGFIGTPDIIKDDGKLFYSGVFENADGTTEHRVIPMGEDSQLVSKSTGEGAQEKRVLDNIASADKVGQDALAKRDAQLKIDIDGWSMAKDSLNRGFPDLKTIMDKTPGSTISSGVSALLSGVVGNTEGKDAQAKIAQYGALLLQSVPILPGPQSDNETLQRQKTLGELDNPNITVKAKMDMIARYMEVQEGKSAAANAILNPDSGANDLGDGFTVEFE